MENNRLTPNPALIEDRQVQEQQVKKMKLVHSMRIHPGHKVFELDLATGIAKLAEIEGKDAKHNFKTGQTSTHTRINQKENHLYCSALNLKNAVKHFNNRFVEMFGKPKK